LFRNSNKLINRLFDVLKGKLSIVGLYPVADNVLCRTGLTGMVHISKPEKLTIQAINRLNDYYLMNYTFSLDIEIILKKLFRK
jgi:lipopolysaccharide/colanic/teichoic acid biosynthesis glycosyltransferase